MILIGYPGMSAIIHHRLAHLLYRLGARLIARLIAVIVHTRTGIDIHPDANIGSGLHRSRVRRRYGRGPTIIGKRSHPRGPHAGAWHFPTDGEGNLVKSDAHHPIVEDDVVIYADATILGRMTIGHGSTIGGNVWLTQHVPANNIVTQATARNSRARLLPGSSSASGAAPEPRGGR